MAKLPVGKIATLFTLISMIPAATWAIGSVPFTSLPVSGDFDRLRQAYEEVRKESKIRDLLEDARTNALSLSQRISGEAFETTKFQHYYKGLEVIGSMAFHHSGVAGTSIREKVAAFDLDTRPTLNEASAIALAQFTVGDRVVSQPELKILPEGEKARLVYWLTVPRNEADAGRDVIVDAHTGEIVGNMSHNIEIAPVQVFDASNKGIWVELKKDIMGNISGCKVTDLATNKVTNVSATECNSLVKTVCQVQLQRSPKYDDRDPVIINPAKCTIAYRAGKAVGTPDASAKNAAFNSNAALTYYKSRHNRDSFDNRGSALVSIVHAGYKYTNAHWSSDQKIMVYGDGDGVDFADFTLALDVAGHEMTHGVTSQTAKLIYMGESGALNEAYSDFFGKMIEGNMNDWTIGRKIFLKGNNGIRDLARPGSMTFTEKRDAMGNPVKRPYPAHVKEMMPVSRTCDGSNDNCWVHINSTVPGHAAFLAVQAIGPEKTEKIWYATLTQNLTANETFASATKATLDVCGKMYDAATCTKLQQAFAKVGL